jgi:DNA polymerase
LQLLQPKAVLLIGGVAASAMLSSKDGVLKLRGRTFPLEVKNLHAPIAALAMLHPAYLLRRPQDKRLAWADLLTAEAWLDKLGVARMEAL